MTHHDQYVLDTTGLTDRQKAIHDYLTRTEIQGSGKSPFSLSHAERGRSGYSIGWAQLDLTKQENARHQVMELLRKSGQFDGQTVDAIRNALAKPGKSAVIEAQLPKINAVLGSEAGRPVVSELHKTHLRDVDRTVGEVIAAAKPEHRKFLDSPAGHAIIANIKNQTGNANKFKEFVSGGGPAQFNGRDHKLDGPLDLEKALDYMGDYRYFQENPDDFARREGIYRGIHDETSGRPAPPPADGKDGKPGANAQPPQGDKPGAPPAPDGKPQAGAGAAPTTQKFSADDLHRQESDALQARLGEKEDPMDEILLKRPKKWTEDELHTVMASDDYWGGAQRSGEALSKTGAWFDHVYGDKRTAGGTRLADARVPGRPQPAMDPAGGDLLIGVRKVGFRLADKALETGWPKAVTTLQSGLNELAANPARPDSADGYGRVWTPSLKEDGDFGPKTRLALKQNVAAFGSPAVMRLFDEDNWIG